MIMRTDAAPAASGGAPPAAPESGPPADAQDPAAPSRLPAFRALTLIAGLHLVPADAQALLHRLGLPAAEPATCDDLLLAAKTLGLKARRVRTTAERLPLTPLPALALMRDGSFAVLAQCDGRRVLLQRFGQAAVGTGERPVVEALAAFEAAWSGELILVTSRASLAGERAKFEFSWFVPSLVKHRHLLGEVMLLSCFLHICDENGYVAPNPSRLPISERDLQWYCEQNELRREFLREERIRLSESLERTVPSYGLPPPPPVPRECNRDRTGARVQPRRDPLAIDLDADGIETLGIPAPGSGSPVLFDHDADGIRTGTGWLRPDDAWLVRDIDANGTIDGGHELFGVDTVLITTWSELTPQGTITRSSSRNAYTGFEALRALDSNRDGQFNTLAGSAGDRLWLLDWYSGSAYQIERFRDADGSTLSNIQAAAMVNAMGSFAPPVDNTGMMHTGYATTGRAGSPGWTLMA
jgi:hypothetical protein